MANPTIADAVGRGYLLLDDPAQADLPISTATALAGESAQARAIDLELAEHPFLMESKLIRPNRQDVSLDVEFSALGFVTARSRGSTDDWVRIDVVDLPDYPQRRAERSGAVSVYGTPPRLLFAPDYAAYEYTVWYVPVQATRTQQTDELPLPAMFFTLIAADWALDAIHLVKNRDDAWRKMKTAYISAKRSEWEERFKKYLQKPRHRGPARKEPFSVGRGPHVRIGADGLPRA